MSAKPTPFRLEVSDDAIADLHERLARTPTRSAGR